MTEKAKTELILQVLGNSDVRYDGEEGLNILKNESADSLEALQEAYEFFIEEIDKELERVCFPLIEKLRESFADKNVIFCLLLTDQRQWMKFLEESGKDAGEGWNKVVASDGIWWQSILEKWCEAQGIEQYSISLEVKPEIPNGAADWEGMAKEIEPLLKPFITFADGSISFTPPGGDKKNIDIDNLIVQHSSGTPALSGALYLWGIEHKLAGKPVEFVYLSKQEREDELATHSGSHWQWRLKVPQVRQLLEIQDFAGARQLLQGHSEVGADLQKKLEFLDRAVSLNISKISKQKGLSVREGVIERIAIALWSERAFRDRGQWMHWILRIAGALELALLLLVEKQGNGRYEWRQSYSIKLLYDSDQDIAPCPVSKIVEKLLSEGSYRHNSPKTPRTFCVNRLEGADWSKFAVFYNSSWLEIEPGTQRGFLAVRNELYHKIVGDRIDIILDEETEKRGSATKKNHPSQVAVKWLEYVIWLAGATAETRDRVESYRQEVAEIKKNL